MIFAVLILLGIFGMVVAALKAGDKDTITTIHPDGRITEREGSGPVVVLRGARKQP